MKKMLGNKVDIFLKFGDEISGILFDIEIDCIYVQADAGVLIAIPKENIKYYVCGLLSNSELIGKPTKELQQTILDALEVTVDQVFIIKIPVPPSFDLSIYNDDIMRVVLGNPDVQVALSDKIQKSVEYFPGRIHIITNGEDTIPVTPTDKNTPQDSFSMSGPGDPTGSYLNPSQMVNRLNNSIKRKPEGVKDDE